MRKIFWVIILNLFLLPICYAAKPVYVLEIKGPIGPATQNYISRGLDIANKQHAALVIITLDTTGGLEKSTHKIIQNMMASPIPIVTYITPANAQVANTGLSILYASNIAAMTPGTHLGTSSTLNTISSNYFTLPVIQKNAVNAYVANIRSLAELRHRNAAWAENAARNPVSVTAEEALKENIINLIATDIPQLLQKLNGYAININQIPLLLDTKDSIIQTIKPNWHDSILLVITNPIIVYLLLLIGICGVFFEFMNPGKTLPGLIGVISLIITFYAFQLLPMNFIGLTLLLIGITCMTAEMAIANLGITGACGIIIFIIGSMLLLESNAPGYRIHWPLMFTISLAGAGFFFLILSSTAKSIYKPVIKEKTALIGKIGEVLEFHAHYVMVRVQGEIWSAQTHSHLEIGQKVRVTKISNLILTVEPIAEIGGDL